MSKVTDLTIRKLKPKEKPYDESLGNSLYITVRPSGKKLFYLRYTTADGQRSKKALGEYPILTFAKAMLKAEEQKILTKTIGNLHTAEKEKREKHRQHIKNKEESDFLVLTQKFIEDNILKKKWSKATSEKRLLKINKYLVSNFGDMSINDIKIDSINNLLQQIISQGHFETARMMGRILYNIFEFADTLGYINEENTITLIRIKRLLSKLPASAEKSRYQFMTNAEINTLLHRIDTWEKSTIQVRTALKIAPLLALRPNELCSLLWEDVNFGAKEIIIPADRMTTKKAHLVPLSSQALKLLDELRNQNLSESHVFISTSTGRSISTNSIIQILRKMGYTSATHEHNNFTTHGFRGLFTTIARQDLKYDKHIVETQLAHTLKDKIEAAYHKIHLRSFEEERRKLMQDYADYLDKLKA